MLASLYSGKTRRLLPLTNQDNVRLLIFVIYLLFMIREELALIPAQPTQFLLLANEVVEQFRITVGIITN